MANIKSAKKRILVNRKKADINKAVKTKTKTMIKNVEAAVAAGDKDLAQTSLNKAVAQIQKANVKGVLKKNTASRKISHLAKKVNNIA